MNKAIKVFLFISALLVVLFLVGCLFSYIFAPEYVTNTHEIGEDFSDISVFTDTADIILLPSDDGKCKVVCHEPENQKHSVAVQDSALTINVVNERKWYHYIGITWKTPKITVYLPEAEYTSLFIKASTGDIDIPKDFKLESIDITTSTGDVMNRACASGFIKIKTSTGNIRIEDVSAGALDLSVSTGDITASSISCGGDVKVGVSTGVTRLTDISCKSVTSSGSTGDISLKNVIASEHFSIERSTGDVNFDACDAAEIFVKTDTGEVEGSLLTDKVFITKTDTGDIEVPKTTTGGRCEITTDTGDIEIEIIDD